MSGLTVVFLKNGIVVDTINFGTTDSVNTRTMIESLIHSRRLRLKPYDTYQFKTVEKNR